MITINIYLGSIKLRSFTIDDSDIDDIHHYMPRNLQYDRGALRFEVLLSEPSQASKQFTMKPIDERKLRVMLAYKTLGMNATNSMDEVKAKYRVLVKLYHPDNRESCNVARYREVVAAYNTIVGK